MSEWMKNEGKAPPFAVVDIKLNIDEPDMPGVGAIRYGVRWEEWDWSTFDGVRITHYRKAVPFAAVEQGEK